MTTIEELDRLQLVAVSAEAAASGGASLRSLNITSAQAAQAEKYLTVVPAAQARARTDAQITRLRATPEIGTKIDPVETSLAGARVEIDALTGASRAQTRAIYYAATVAYGTVHQLISALQREAAEALVTGRYGAGSPALLKAAAQLQAVSDIELLGASRTAMLYRTYFAPPSQLLALRDSVRDLQGAYTLSAARLPDQLSPPLVASWMKLTAGPGRILNELATRNLAAPRGIEPDPQDMLITAPQIAPYLTGLSSLLDQAVKQGETAAAQDRSDARNRALTAVLILAALLGLTLGVLVLLGHTLRLRLAQLATSAQRLSSGQFEAITVHSPREIALIGAGLNDAVLNLRQVAATAELLAAGDVTSPEVNRATPGPLGAAVHASVVLLADAIRRRQQLEEQLGHQAAHDSLTGLPNRSAAERIIQDALPTDGQGQVAVLFVDLDHFKPVNDTYGHPAGDHVLQVSAARMQAQLRETDIVARFGGDEFVVVLRTGDTATVTTIGQRIVEALREPIPYEGHTIQIGASIGAAIAQPGQTDTAELLTRADLALYRAKAAGRNNLAY